jgi:hypothetical protein
LNSLGVEGLFISGLVTELMLRVEKLHIVEAAEAEIIFPRIANFAMIMIADEILLLRQRTPSDIERYTLSFL